MGDDFPRAVEELREWAVERGCITIAAHPGYSRYHGIPLNAVSRMARLFDAIEVWNAYTPPHFNLLAMKLADDLGHTPVSGSDAHVPSMVGVAPTLVEVDSDNAEGVVEAIARARTRPTIGFPGVRAIIENIGWSIYRVID
ncbi:PHP domain-containing protein [Aeropyrum camini]|uniref:PHP domain-containing protein n=1 Tax=Aeropyrum camini TaxID=229980 RepID=UPI00078762A4|nr:PHP-associated domain-containing protein [Aeropyrum camini]